MLTSQDRPTSNVYNNSRSFSIFSRTLTGIKTRGDKLLPETLGSDDHRILSRSQIVTDIYERQALIAASEGLLLLADGWGEDSPPARWTRGALTRHRIGITALPREVLLEIFDLMLIGETKYAIIEANVMISFLSSVCRHFRQAILGFPRVWGYMNLGWLGKEGVRRHLARSKKMPLYIQFDYTSDIGPALLQALEHRDRWAYLRCYFVSREGKVLDSLPTLTFPALKKLRIYVGNDVGGSRCDDLFSTWSFPNLHDLVLQDHIPKSGAFLQSTGSMTTLRYCSELAKYRFDGTFMTSLVGLLGPASSLRTLELDVSQLSEGLAAEEPDDVLLLPSVTHFTLTTLNRKLSCQDDPLSSEDFASILSVLRMPNIQRLSISMLTSYEPHLDVFSWPFVSLNPLEKGMKHLTDFELILRWWGIPRPWEGRPDIPIYRFFWTFPALRNLSIDAEDCTHSFEVDDEYEPNLGPMRSLRIMDWNCETKVHDVLRDMERRGAQPEEIYIHAIRQAIDMAKVTTVFPGVNITLIGPRAQKERTAIPGDAI